METCRDNRMQIEIYNVGNRHTPTTNSIYCSSVVHPPHMNMKKRGGGSSSTSKIWSLSDPELQRKKRIASYKVYSVGGKMKLSLRKSFTWIKRVLSG
ncbi:hypothetical protein LguiB_008451 [Lonicera macranthoides]